MLHLQGAGSASERTPLLTAKDLDLEGLADRAAETENEQLFLDWENRPWYMVCFHLWMSLASVSTVLGAYFFLRSVGHEITPKCYELKDERLGPMDLPDNPHSKHWNGLLCDMCTLCFWTYPLVCPLAVVMVFSKNLLDARLYYECLMHGVLLDFRNSSYIYSPTAWLLFIHGSLSVCAVHWIRDSSALGDAAVGKGDEGADSSSLMFGLLAYFLPVFAFLVVVLCRWSVEWYLIPLAKFCEMDHKAGVRLLDKCVFIEEVRFRDAFEAVAEALDGKEAEAPGRSAGPATPKPPLRTPEFLRAIAEAALRKARRPPRCCGGDCAPYWVYRLLFSRHLRDGRAREFRIWATVYGIFLVLALAVFVWVFVLTAVEVLRFERVIPSAMVDDLDQLTVERQLARLITTTEPPPG